MTPAKTNTTASPEPIPSPLPEPQDLPHMKTADARGYMNYEEPKAIVSPLPEPTEPDDTVHCHACGQEIADRKKMFWRANGKIYETDGEGPREIPTVSSIPEIASEPILRDYWRCFHCDFATYNRAEAEAHFGDRDDAEEFKPLCKWWQLMSEDERIEALQDTIQQLNEANSAEVAVCPKCRRPHYNMEDSAACRSTPVPLEEARQLKPAVVTSDAGVVEGIFTSYEAALAWAEQHRMGIANIRGGAPFHDVEFPTKALEEAAGEVKRQWSDGERQTATEQICIGGREAALGFFTRHPHLGLAVAIDIQCEVNAALRELQRLQEDKCDVCCGEALPGGKKCICGGSGRGCDEKIGLRKECTHLESELQRVKEENERLREPKVIRCAYCGWKTESQTADNNRWDEMCKHIETCEKRFSTKGHEFFRKLIERAEKAEAELRRREGEAFNAGVEAAAVAVEETWEGWPGIPGRIRREKRPPATNPEQEEK